jgi:hypothetical protein
MESIHFQKEKVSTYVLSNFLRYLDNVVSSSVVSILREKGNDSLKMRGKKEFYFNFLVPSGTYVGHLSKKTFANFSFLK